MRFRKQKNTDTPDVAQKESDGKTIVYIDGENAFFHIFNNLRYQKLVKNREDLVKFNFRGLIDGVLKPKVAIEYRYYGAKLKENDETQELLKRTQKMIDHKRRWIGYISNQGVTYRNAGELKVREENGPNGGSKKEHNLTFVEKGIDVTIATDMLEDAMTGKCKAAVIMSSDRDLLPALQALQRNNTKVVYLGFEGRINDQMAGTADRTVSISSKDIAACFKEAQ